MLLQAHCWLSLLQFCFEIYTWKLLSCLVKLVNLVPAFWKEAISLSLISYDRFAINHLWYTIDTKNILIILRNGNWEIDISGKFQFQTYTWYFPELSNGRSRGRLKLTGNSPTPTPSPFQMILGLPDNRVTTGYQNIIFGSISVFGSSNCQSN